MQFCRHLSRWRTFTMLSRSHDHWQSTASHDELVFFIDEKTSSTADSAWTPWIVLVDDLFSEKEEDEPVESSQRQRCRRGASTAGSGFDRDDAPRCLATLHRPQTGLRARSVSCEQPARVYAELFAWVCQLLNSFVR